MATKVKGGVIAANALTKLAAQVDTDLKEGCGGLARDLGSNIAFKTGPEACEAAGKALADIKAKLGAKANIAMTVSEPQCSMSLGMMTDCASACDASVKGGKAEATCEGGEISGKCDGECTGACQAAAPATPASPAAAVAPATANATANKRRATVRVNATAFATPMRAASAVANVTAAASSTRRPSAKALAVARAR